MEYTASVIVSFYNKTAWLKLLIASLERQTAVDFEVIIADDGSHEEAVNTVRSIIAESPLHIRHIWHEDKGFMKTAMLNKAVLASNSSYLIFIDGDCIAHPRFVEDHFRLRREHQVLAGRRVNMSEEISKMLNPDKIHRGILDNRFAVKLLYNSIIGSTKDAEKGVHINSSLLNRLFGTSGKRLLGSNFSIAKQDLLAINGFDERYIHPGVGEDSELDLRLNNSGMSIFGPAFCLIQYHLWHPRLSREFEAENLMLMEETIKNRYTATPYGIIS